MAELTGIGKLRRQGDKDYERSPSRRLTQNVEHVDQIARWLGADQEAYSNSPLKIHAILVVAATGYRRMNAVRRYLPREE